MTRNLVFILVLLIFIYLLIPSVSKKNNDLKGQNNKELRGIFVSYIELSNYIKGKSEEESKKNIEKIIEKTENSRFFTSKKSYG